MTENTTTPAPFYPAPLGFTAWYVNTVDTTTRPRSAEDLTSLPVVGYAPNDHGTVYAQVLTPYGAVFNVHYTDPERCLLVGIYPNGTTPPQEDVNGTTRLLPPPRVA